MKLSLYWTNHGKTQSYTFRLIVIFIFVYLSDQIERVRFSQRRVYANVRTVSVLGDTLRASDADRPRLRVGGKRMRVQAKRIQSYGPRASVYYSSNASSVDRFAHNVYYARERTGYRPADAAARAKYNTSPFAQMSIVHTI